MITTDAILTQYTLDSANRSTTLLRTADTLFRQAQLNGLLNKLAASLQKRRLHLVDLDDFIGLGKVVQSTYTGIHAVPICQVIGSEGRSSDFDHQFNPLRGNTKQRWLSIAIARQQDTPLPPVALVKVGEVYFVRDGHHRVSVARAFGEQYIEAEVTEWAVARPGTTSTALAACPAVC